MRSWVAFSSGASTGLLLGVLIGLSTSPVVGTVVGGLVTVMTAFFGLKEVDVAVNTQAAVVQGNHERRLLLMGFGIASLLGTLLGLTIRTHSLLSPSIASEVQRLTEAGYPVAEARSLVARRFYTAGGQAAPENSVLFSATQAECDQANPATFDTSTTIFALYEDAGGRWAEYAQAIRSLDTLPEAARSTLLKAGWEVACR